MIQKKRIDDSILIISEKKHFNRILQGIAGMIFVVTCLYFLIFVFSEIPFISVKAFLIILVLGSFLIFDSIKSSKFFLTRYKTYGIGILLTVFGLFIYLGIKSLETANIKGLILTFFSMFLVIHGLHLLYMYFKIIGFKYFIKHSYKILKKHWKNHLIAIIFISLVLGIYPLLFWTRGLPVKAGITIIIIIDIIFIWSIYAGDAFEETLKKIKLKS